MKSQFWAISTCAVLTLSSLTGCGRFATPTSSQQALINDLSEFAQGATDSINTAVKDRAGLAMKQTPRFEMLAQLWDQAVPSASAITSVVCGEPSSVANVCSSGRLTRTWQTCTLPRFNYELSGDVIFDFTGTTASQCKLAVGGTVTRKPNLTIIGKKDGSLRITAEPERDYRENTVGGGQQISRIGSTLATLTIAGIHRKLIAADGSIKLHVSTRTTEPIALNLTNEFSALVMDGGKLQVSHNILKATAEWVPNKLTWVPSCACPTSGSMKGTLNGTMTGDLEVSYGPNCGDAKVISQNAEASFKLESCFNSP